jgi:hypothetical protein
MKLFKFQAAHSSKPNEGILYSFIKSLKNHYARNILESPIVQRSSMLASEAGDPGSNPGGAIKKNARRKRD